MLRKSVALATGTRSRSLLDIALGHSPHRLAAGGVLVYPYVIKRITLVVRWHDTCTIKYFHDTH